MGRDLGAHYHFQEVPKMNIVEFAQHMTNIGQEKPELEVLAASDEEGHSFNALVDWGIYLVEKSYTGETLEGGEIHSLEDLVVEDEYTEDEVERDFKEVLVLWP